MLHTFVGEFPHSTTYAHFSDWACHWRCQRCRLPCLLAGVRAKPSGAVQFPHPWGTHTPAGGTARRLCKSTVLPAAARTPTGRNTHGAAPAPTQAGGCADTLRHPLAGGSSITYQGEGGSPHLQALGYHQEGSTCSGSAPPAPPSAGSQPDLLGWEISWAWPHSTRLSASPCHTTLHRHTCLPPLLNNSMGGRMVDHSTHSTEEVNLLQAAR